MPAPPPDFTMSQTSDLSRYRPAIFVITGAAAALGIYTLYSTFSEPTPKSGLHRSNAVHRRRQPVLVVEYAPPGPHALLGEVVISAGLSKDLTDVNSVGAPTVAQVRERFPNVPEEMYPQHVLDSIAVKSVMNACFLAQRDEQKQAQLRQCGLDGISEAMEARDVGRVISLAVPLVHQIVDTSPEVIQSATLEFLAHVGLTVYRRAEDSQVQQTLATNGNPESSEIAETEEISGFDDASREPEQGLKGLLYHIAETDAKRKAYEHRGINCEECGEKPIRGVRWHCLNCPDFDLCSTCEASTAHQKTHVFVKIRIPLPVLSQPTRVYPIWYPGQPHKMFHALAPEMKTHFRQAHDLDNPHLDAHFDQFTSIANVPWKEDPAHVKAAIDRRAFNKALTCERWPNRFRPNLLYDRMFAFYDTDRNALIGFGEFLSGIAYLRGPRRFTPLRRALEGFDIDGDAHVDRRDFLRLLKAKFEIQKLVINDMVEGQETEQTQAAMDTLRSSQPISSIFSWEEIPQGEERIPVGKARDANGDLQPLEGTKTILDDDEGWPVERPARQRHLPAESHEQLRHHLSRFEELLSSPTEGAGGQHDGPSSSEDTQSRKVTIDNATDDTPLDQDLIWQMTEDGFNEMLDRMFKAKEEEDREVTEARAEIEQWKEEIDEAMKRKEELKKALEAELQAADTVDPLLATAMNSLNGSVQVKPRDGPGSEAAPAFKSSIVPTDEESLTKREEEIAKKPLDELLSATGYSAIDDAEISECASGAANGHAREMDGDSDSSVRSADSELERILGLDGTSALAPTASSPQLDPTMPQNRPNSALAHPSAKEDSSSSDSKADGPPSQNGNPASSPSKDAERPPSQERLEHLGALAAREANIKARGGPGKLSFDEIEAIVKQDTSKELKGLVTGWLDWASF